MAEAMRCGNRNLHARRRTVFFVRFSEIPSRREVSDGLAGRTGQLKETGMNSNGPLASGEPAIEADLGTNGGKVSFYSIEDASIWIRREIERWEDCLTKFSDSDDSIIMDRLEICGETIAFAEEDKGFSR